MAETVRFQGVDVKIRHPWGVFGLTLITLGIYGIVYWYKINRELRDYSAAVGQPLDNNPWLAVLAVFPGSLIVVPLIMTCIYTARRVRAVRKMIIPDDSGENPSSPLTAVIGTLASPFHLVYVQYALNTAWRRAREAAGALTA